MKRTDYPRESLSSDAELRVNKFGKLFINLHKYFYLEKKYKD